MLHEYKNVSQRIENTSEGREVAAGERIWLSDDEVKRQANRRLFDENLLVPTGGEEEEEDDKKQQRAKKGGEE